MAKLYLGTREITPAIYTGGATTTLSVTPTTSAQNFTPTSPYIGYSSVSVSSVTSSIDANITAGNIKKDVTILGVTGTYEGSGGGNNEWVLTDTGGDYPEFVYSDPDSVLTFPVEFHFPPFFGGGYAIDGGDVNYPLVGWSVQDDGDYVIFEFDFGSWWLEVYKQYSQD